MTRDIALVVAEGVAHDALVAAIQDDPEGLVRRVTLFDIYRPVQPQPGLAAGERSMALRLELLDPAATPTDARIDAAVAAAVARAAQAVGARLRG